LKKNLILIITAIFLASCVVFIPMRGSGDYVRVPVLLYHNLAADDDGLNPLLHITPPMFKEHMQTLKDAGYETIFLDEYYEYIKNRRTLPSKPIIITFDDGYVSNYSYAYPILRSLGMKATIFIVTSTVGVNTNVSYPHFTWIQAREMQKSGVIDIQSHSHTHPEMSLLSVPEMIREVRMSRYLIEKNLGKKCLYFAYPFGFYKEEALRFAAEAGYLMQFGIGEDADNTEHMINRIIVPGDIDGQGLLELIDKESVESEVEG